MTGPGECCPSSWDCGAWQRRLEAPGQCWYQGSLYSPGEDIPEVSEANGCNQACQCSLNSRGLAEIICAVSQTFVNRDGITSALLLRLWTALLDLRAAELTSPVLVSAALRASPVARTWSSWPRVS